MVHAVIESMCPFFIVKSVEKSVAFYRNRLGFTTLHREPERKPIFAILNRDGATLFIKSGKAEPLPNPMRDPDMSMGCLPHGAGPGQSCRRAGGKRGHIQLTASGHARRTARVRDHRRRRLRLILRPTSLTARAVSPSDGPTADARKTGYATQMRPLWHLEWEVLGITAAEYTSSAEVLHRQIDTAQVVSFENSGAGFFSGLIVAPDAPQLFEKSPPSGAYGNVLGVEDGMGFMDFPDRWSPLDDGGVLQRQWPDRRH